MTGYNPPHCKRCNVEMEIVSHGMGCSMFWRCPACLCFGEYVPPVDMEVLHINIKEEEFNGS